MRATGLRGLLPGAMGVAIAVAITTARMVALPSETKEGSILSLQKRL
eukprot:CAMPEP_0170193266 /NCGR_PEP_ID=MMETSP0040_2-20121228/56491_1 /TAXON_ID=641309 /ORGANISM="Lotharella oceanica, Strain CCMP622" /LENGTH=46 /DNA_ID= /DNA_START= /DNA_END= /DNA_ORIENTATION=